MASFQFIETFFFLSLGITFGLVLLLVYHFKQRITTLEQKCDTMFDIVQNVVKELGVAKTNINYMLTNQMQSHTNFATFPSMFMPNMNTASNNYISEMNLCEEHEGDDEDEEDEEDEDDEEDLSKYTKEYFESKEALIENFRESAMYETFKKQLEAEKAKYWKE